MGWIRWLVGGIGASIIYALIWIFGRTRRWRDVPWLAGPVGSRVVGDAPYQEAAAAEGLTIERNAEDGGLIPDMAALGGNGFEPSRLPPGGSPGTNERVSTRRERTSPSEPGRGCSSGCGRASAG